MAVNLTVSLALLKWKSKTILSIGVAINLLVLGWFKYRYFFLGIDEGKIVVPLAMSFFTFQQIAYLADIYKREIKPFKFSEYCFCVTFFPHLIAGPLVRYPDIRKQLDDFEEPLARHRVEMFREGLVWISFGLAKKVLLADTFGAYADLVFDAANPPDSLSAILATVAFSLQIYFDFSAYSEIAIGLGLMLGIRLPLNFDAPYLSLNVAEFWRRWHITLGDFLRRYLYFPLGGNRKGLTRTGFNVMVTMFLAGLWHGAGWNFIVWGGMHGVLIMLSHGVMGVEDRYSASRFYRSFAIAFTFTIVTLTWVMFRAPDLGFALDMYGSIFFLPAVNAVAHEIPDLPVQLSLVFGLLLVFMAPRVGVVAQQFSGRPATTMFAAGVIGALALVALVIGNVGARFVYFQF